MGYDVDYDYPFTVDGNGTELFPDGVTESDGLYVLPNGRYMPPGHYLMKDGSSLIYEPGRLNPYFGLIDDTL